MALRCPACKVDLYPIANRTGVAAVCGPCGGIWLDNVSSRSVVKNFLEPAIKETARNADVAMASAKAEQSAQAAGGYRAPALRPEGDAAAKRLCAECGVPLVQAPFHEANIMLDVCGPHGTWFDAGELWQMSQHFEMKSHADDSEAMEFGREMSAHRRNEAFGDLRAAGIIVGFLRR